MNRRQFFCASSLLGLSLAVGKGNRSTAKVVAKPKVDPNSTGWKYSHMASISIDVNGKSYWMPVYVPA